MPKIRGLVSEMCDNREQAMTSTFLNPSGASFIVNNFMLTSDRQVEQTIAYRGAENRETWYSQCS